MATFKGTILKKDVKEGDKPTKAYNVKIRVTHERKTSYISTEHYVSKKQLTKELELKDEVIFKEILDRIVKYREQIVKLSGRIHLYSAQELADWLVNQSKKITINFPKFSQEYIDKLKASGRKGTSENLQTALLSVIDFMKKDSFSIDEINSKMLERYEAYLRTERIITRQSRSNKHSENTLVTTTKAPLSNSGIVLYMAMLRQLFNAARDEYNDEDKGEIAILHYPFKKYKLPRVPKTKKRNIKEEAIVNIRDLEIKGKRENLAKDIFMLSFYLIGINSADLFNINTYKNGRLSYNRTKTKRKKGEAYLSVKVEPEALPFIEKYKDRHGKRVFDFYNMYSDFDGFNTALNYGLKEIAKALDFGFKLEYYYARHSWATIARNKCRIHTDDISMALTHSVQEHKTTDIYIEEDFTIIDEANRKVLDTLK